jgi:uncharacterized membrane protein
MKWLKIILVIFFAIMMVYFLMLETVKTNDMLDKAEYPEIAYKV